MVVEGGGMAAENKRKNKSLGKELKSVKEKILGKNALKCFRVKDFHPRVCSDKSNLILYLFLLSLDI